MTIDAGILTKMGQNYFWSRRFLIFVSQDFLFWKSLKTQKNKKWRNFSWQSIRKRIRLAFRKYITPLFELSWIFLMLLWCMDFHADVIGSFDFDFWCVCWETKHFFASRPNDSSVFHNSGQCRIGTQYDFIRNIQACA